MRGRSMWSPGIAFMQGLTFASKARVIGFVFLIPVAVLGAIVALSYLDSRNFTLRERQGVELLQSLANVNQQLVTRRDADRGLQVGLELWIVRKNSHAAVESLLKELGVTLARSPDHANLLPAFNALKLRALDKGAEGTTPTEVLGAAGLDLVAEVGDVSGLILDPDVDTLYLSLLSIQVLPAMVDELGQLRAWSSYLYVAGKDLPAAELAFARQNYSVWDTRFAGQRQALSRLRGQGG